MAAYSAAIADQAATVWLLRVTEKVVTKVPKQAAVRTKRRPQSVPPCRSARRASSHSETAHGRALSVSRMAGTTSQRCRSSVIDQPARCNSQYSPATKVGKSGGLLE